MLGAVGARYLGRDVAVVLEEVQVAPGELGEVVRLAGLAADRAGELAAAVGGDLQVKFVRLFAGVQALTDQSPRRRHPQPQSQYGIRVHLYPVRLDLRQRASVLVTVQDATRRFAMGLRPSWTVTARAGFPGAGRDERMVVVQSNKRMTMAPAAASDGGCGLSRKPPNPFAASRRRIWNGAPGTTCSARRMPALISLRILWLLT